MTNPLPNTVRETLPAFARIGLLSFGGPAAQIALMHKVLVEEHGWLTEKQFLGRFPSACCCQARRQCNWRPIPVGG